MIRTFNKIIFWLAIIILLLIPFEFLDFNVYKFFYYWYSFICMIIFWYFLRLYGLKKAFKYLYDNILIFLILYFYIKLFIWILYSRIINQSNLFNLFSLNFIIFLLFLLVYFLIIYYLLNKKDSIFWLYFFVLISIYSFFPLIFWMWPDWYFDNSIIFKIYVFFPLVAIILAIIEWLLQEPKDER